jgi:hypothetical protein
MCCSVTVRAVRRKEQELVTVEALRLVPSRNASRIRGKKVLEGTQIVLAYARFLDAIYCGGSIGPWAVSSVPDHMVVLPHTVQNLDERLFVWS